MPLFRLALLALLVALPLTALMGCDSDDEDEELTPAAVGDLATIIVATPTYSSLEVALAAADLLDALAGDGELTLFAPEDAAFTQLNAVTGGAVNALFDEDNRDALAAVLSYHVVPQRITAADLSNRQTLTTLQGAELTVRQVGSDFFVEGARIVAADIEANNGVLHRIDKVLTGAVDVVGLASIAPNLAGLVAALAEADLVGTLQGGGPFTVFAPQSTTFAATGEALQNQLLYHVVPGLVYASDLTDGGTAATSQGEAVTFTFGVDEGNPDDPDDDEPFVLVNEATIVATDFAVANGIVHLIDGPLSLE